MRNRMIACFCVLMMMVLATSCAGERGPGTMRFHEPSMVTDGMDGGLPKPMPPSYLQHLPSH